MNNINDKYGCYPGVITQFAYDDTKRGCGEYQFSGQRFSITPCGSCCIFCLPVTVILDIAFFIPCGLGWGANKLIKKCKKEKPQVTIQNQPKT